MVLSVNLLNSNQSVKSLSFKAQDEQKKYSYSPVQTNAPKAPTKKNDLKKHITAQNVAAVLGIVASTVMVAFFGKIMINDYKAKKLLQNAIKESVKDFNVPNANSVLDVINDCVDPILRRAATNEYNKGPMMSQKRINDILSLANLDKAKPEEINLLDAMKLMEKKIVGMDEVKEEILDFLIEQNYNLRNGIKPKKPLVLCLDGPAGTGKTTISEVIAEAMGMHYKKIPLNGASGKAPIKGYEAVYTGASSGGIAQGQLEGKTKKVLYCLDEADKTASSDYNGKVEDTLLSLFDDQALFTDDNLDVPIDVTKSIFILTTNDFEKLSAPLKNRVRKMSIAPYGVDIKAKIAKLKMEDALKSSNLDSSKVEISSDKVYQSIAEMTKDQGGRETNQNVISIIKKIITKIELGENNGKPVVVTPEFVKRELGPVAQKESLSSRVLKSKKLNPSPNPQINPQLA